ncbi:hypothetical protein [Paenibacillus eucommiae]|uniref:Membrane protein YagU involved in acid resistance n=1 Tax=Paenibacillus eucommiae TaxID=1355755 RepID=A0ABS4J277_9BACL|nr:hypothetical protein [Paenibacillus eucommiae]MBP1993900.1 putative membrane protein YagU involved in acid resistance [Paenibacillus eucommiae]
MPMIKIVFRGSVYGLITGFILGFFFKLIEANGLADVYTLLLNVDFLPFFPEPLPEWQEFSFHLIVAIVIGIVFTLLIQYRPNPWLWGALLGLVPVPLFIPLTLLSHRTPSIYDVSALCWWIAGHVLYSISLSVFGIVWQKNSSRNRS